MNFAKKMLAPILLASTLIFTSCGGKDGTNVEIPGVDGPKVSLLQDQMVINLTFEGVELEGGLIYKIPKYKNSYLEIKPSTKGGTAMKVTVSLQDILNTGLQNLDPQTLPGGRALPGISRGRLPAVAFSVEKFHNMTFYVGPEVFGIFFPANIGLENGIASFRYWIADQRAGTISLVGADQNGDNSGFLLMLDIKGQTKKQMQKIAKRYRK